MAEVLIGLGGNEGDVATAFHTALTYLGRVPGLTLEDVSSYVASPAVTLGPDAGRVYLNAAARFESSLEPIAILDLLQEQEARAGRTREHRWGPRPLDLDLLFHGDRIVETERLIVPHPAAWYRRFVLDPLVEIAPEFVHPEKGLTLRRLQERLLVRPIVIGLAGETRSPAGDVSQIVLGPPELIRLEIWSADKPEPTLLVYLGSPNDRCVAQLPQLPLVRWWPYPSSAFEFILAVGTSVLGPDLPSA